MSEDIAVFLELDNAKVYTRHCFRRTSATFMVHSGGHLLTNKSNVESKLFSVVSGVSSSVDSNIVNFT